jgi:hypothetical protein
MRRLQGSGTYLIQNIRNSNSFLFAENLHADGSEAENDTGGYGQSISGRNWSCAQPIYQEHSLALSGSAERLVNHLEIHPLGCSLRKVDI